MAAAVRLHWPVLEELVRHYWLLLVEGHLTAPIEAAGCILGGGEEAKSEMPDKLSSPAWPRSAFSYLLLAMLVLPSNTAAKLPECPVRPAREYPTAQTRDGLSVALEPIVNRKALKACFGADLVSKGFIPILVVAENRDTGRSFILLKEEVFMSRPGSEFQAEEAGNVHSGKSKAAEALGDTALGVATAPLIIGVSVPPAAAVLFLVAIFKGVKATEAHHRIVKNELRSETLSPGREVHGFLYFPLKRGKERIRNLVVRLTFLTVPENQRSTFDFALPGID